MPNHLPSIDDVIDGNIKFFSLDTSVIHNVGYRFSDEKLLDLYLQLPYQVKLVFPEVVYKEILSHKDDEITRDLKELESSIKKLERKKVLDNNLGISIKLLRENYLHSIDEEIKKYLEKFNGEILNIEDCNISNIFNSYFDRKPPFENNKDKKNEFPDAVCLHLLENYAQENGQCGIIISDDKGWRDFSEESKYLYYAKSLDEFTELFVARNDDISEKIKSKVISALNDKHSALYGYIIEQLDYVEWIPNVYSENLYSCDADVISQNFNSFSLLDIKIWKSDRQGAEWILKVNLLFDIDLEIEVESYFKDWDDKDLVSMGFTKLELNPSPELEFHIICSDIDLDLDCNDWDIDIKLVSKQYMLDDIGVYHSFE